MRWSVLVGILLLLIGLSVLASSTVPTIRERIALSACLLTDSDNAKRECAFSIIRSSLTKNGIADALRVFVAANRLFPKLDLDCHSGIHRVGDMMYYSLYASSRTDILPEDFPPEALMCNHGFYHGIFEHLFQDLPDPQFISDTCRRFKNDDDRRAGAIGYTCFHAAGHGLFRAQAEKISRRDWGKPDAFVTAPIAVCNALPDTNELERFNCVTGVESIFIQMSMLGEYGLSDPDNGLTICDRLNPELYPTCYYVRSLMISQLTNSPLPIIRSCTAAPEPLFKECMRGIIAGLVVNGMGAASLERTLAACVQPEVVRRGDAEYCYQQVTRQMRLEYLGDFTPDCSVFPEAYRDGCRQSSIQP